MNNLSHRKYIVGAIFSIICLIFIIRLFNVQVVNNKYKLDSDNNVLRVITEYPARGLVYDRNGELLVFNEAAYDLMLIPGQLKEIDTTLFCTLFDITKEDFLTKYIKAKSYSRYKPSVFEKELSAATYGNVQDQMYKFPGFFVQTRTLRKYPKNNAAHVLGYIGEVNNSIIEKNSYYKSGDYIGKSGLELAYEELLRGKRGVRKILVDVHNREKGSYNNGLEDTLSVAGQTIYSSLDVDLQAYGEFLMQNKTGSVVAIEPQTGEILCLVSSPGYDPNLLVGRSIKTNYPILTKDSLKPLFNRATMAQYPPGSIFKTIQALIAMQEGVITENSGFACIRSLVGCHNHPTALNVTASIKMSCNPYYHQVFKRLIQQNKAKSIFKDSEIGLAKWAINVKKFGFGGTLETDIPGVKNGLVPGVDFYNRWYGEGRWAFSTIFSLSIGQGELGVIPIQMANLAAIIANKGYYYPPHILKKIEGIDTIPNLFTTKQYVGIDSVYFNPIIEGMRAVIDEPGGTARRAKINGVSVCGKTGTAQNPHGEDHSVFIAFAPMENPKIAIAVYVENSGFGGTWAAPIASLMMEQYLTDSISDKLKEKRILEANLLNVKPKKMRNRTNVFTNLDWVTILTYLVLVIIGWLSIYAAVYNEEHSKIFDLSQRYGNQLLWIGLSLLLALIILMIEGSFFTSFAYPIYGLIILMLIGVLLFGTEIKGAKSWFRIGSFALQPAEFGKFATALALAKFLSVLGINMKDLKTKVTAIAIVILPIILILLQNDTGSMLVYFSFVLVLYREGLSGNVLLAGIYTAFLFITSLLMRIHTFTFFNKEIGGELLLILILVAIGTVTMYFTKKMKKLWVIIIAVLVCSVGIVFSVDYVFNNVLEPHQSKRINVMLGVESDPQGAGYNVNQSLIAIGSGGFSGKGFLNGTQTKFNFVPEQSTDFIFCTIGEEWGFLGTFVLVSLYLFLFLRLIFLAERQRSTFSRIYGYCVASILFFHFLVNIGMTIGLAPVIGIPLPFISYGGSSLWAFTILLFIFIRLDAERIYVLR